MKKNIVRGLTLEIDPEKLVMGTLTMDAVYHLCQTYSYITGEWPKQFECSPQMQGGGKWGLGKIEVKANKSLPPYYAWLSHEEP